MRRPWADVRTGKVSSQLKRWNWFWIPCHHINDTRSTISFRQRGRENKNEGLFLLKSGMTATATATDCKKKKVPRCGIQSSLVTPSCHHILLCKGQGEQTSWGWRGLCWGRGVGGCRFLANAQACWRQGGVLITGCMHFVKWRTINLGNYPSIPPSPRIALFALPFSRVPDQTNCALSCG